MELVQDDVLKLVLALVAGAIIGSEREYRNKTAGFRTITLICFASSLFTILSIKIGASSPDRIAANIVTGIGFLGAGAIFKEDNKISGLTTAATVWVSAAIGMCIGSNNVLLAAVALALIIVILVMLTRLENYIDNINEIHNYKISCKYHDDALFKYADLFKSYNLKATKGKLNRNGDLFTGTWTVVGKHEAHKNFVQNIITNDDIVELEF